MREKMIERDGYLFSVSRDTMDNAYLIYEVYEPWTEAHSILMRTIDEKGKSKWWGMPMDDEKIYELIYEQFPHLKDRRTLKMFGRVYEFIKTESNINK